MTQRLVLDTNVYSFCSQAELARLAERGFLISASEIAFTEALAKSARDYRSGTSRERARGQFFARAKRLAPFMNSICPIALGAGGITRRVYALTQGLPPDTAVEQRAINLNEMWRVAVNSEYPDETWLGFADVAESWLTSRDETLRMVVRTMREQPKPADWATKDHAEQVAAIRNSLTRFWHFSEAMTERLDAHVATVTCRLYEGDGDTTSPRENDGPDLHLTQHLAESVVLVTRDQRLLDIVDRSGSYQAPWVRHPDDLEDLPQGEAWGEFARQQAQSFKRKRVRQRP